MHWNGGATMQQLEAQRWDDIPEVRRRSYQTINAAALNAKHFAPIKYIVPGILPEGLTLLAGKPKFGKSYMAMGLGIAVASGGKAFGSIDCEQGDVLYAALEDNPRRLQSRLRQMLPYPLTMPDRLHIATDWQRVGDGCVEDVDDWLNEHPGARLVILDTLARIKPKSDGRGTLYDEDHSAIRPLQELAGRRGIAVVVIHHVRKSEADDVFDTISGSNGLMGVADTMIVAARKGDLTILAGKGRDIEDYERALTRDALGGWTIGGDASQLASTNERQKVLDALRASNGPIGAREVADLTGDPYDNVRRTLTRMAQAGEVCRVGRGSYTCPNGPNVPNGFQHSDYSDVFEDDDWDSRRGSVPIHADHDAIEWDNGTVGTGA